MKWEEGSTREVTTWTFGQELFIVPKHWVSGPGVACNSLFLATSEFHRAVDPARPTPDDHLPAYRFQREKWGLSQQISFPVPFMYCLIWKFTHIVFGFCLHVETASCLVVGIQNSVNLFMSSSENSDSSKSLRPLSDLCCFFWQASQLCAQQPVQSELVQRCQQLQSRLSTLKIENEEVCFLPSGSEPLFACWTTFHQGQVEGACRECPGYCKEFLGTRKVGLSLLLHPALEIQEVVCTLPKLCSILSFYKNAPLHYTFNQSSTWPLYEQNQISEMTPLMTGFPQHFKKKPVTLTLQTSLIS